MNKKILCFLIAMLMYNVAQAKNENIQCNNVDVGKDFAFSRLNAMPLSNFKNWSRLDTIKFLESQLLVKNIAVSSVNKNIDTASFNRMEKRDFAETWYRLRYERLLGYSPKELQQKLSLDSVTFYQKFDDNHLKWAEQVYADPNKIYEFYLGHRSEWKKPRQYKLSGILIDTSMYSTVLKSLKKNDFASVARRYSLDSATSQNGGELGWYFQGVDPGVLYSFRRWLQDTLYGLDYSVKNKIFDRPIINDKKIFIKVTDFIDEQIPPFDSVADYAYEQFIHERKIELSKRAIDSLAEKFGFEDAELIYPNSKEIYNQFPQYFMSPKAWKLKMIQVSDSVLMEKLMKIKDKDIFSSFLTFNSNFYTKKIFGDLGWYKEGLSLPYDLGELSGVDSVLNQMGGVGLVPKAFKRQFGGWVIFWIDSLRSPIKKSFDRVQGYANVLAKTVPYYFPDSTPLLKKAGHVVIREFDYKSYVKSLNNSDAGPMTRDQYRQQLRWLAVSEEDALRNEFQKTKMWSEILDALRSSMITARVKDSVLKYFGQSARSLDSVLSKKNELFSRVSGDRRRNAALYLSMPSNVLRTEVLRFNDSLGIGVKSIAQSEYDSAFVRIYKSELQKQHLRTENALFSKSCCKMFAPSFGGYLIGNPEANAKRFIEAKLDLKEDEIAYLVPRIMQLDLGDSLRYALARTLSSISRNHEALEVLNTLEYEKPSSGLGDRVLFLKGHIYMDRLKNDSMAIKSFEKLIQRYPKSSLADDADFMIRDIKSGRKLSEELMKKLANPSAK